jgi:hypothetical protein
MEEPFVIRITAALIASDAQAASRSGSGQITDVQQPRYGQ